MSDELKPLAKVLAEIDHDGCFDNGGSQLRRNYYHREAGRLIGKLAIAGYAVCATRSPLIAHAVAEELSVPTLELAEAMWQLLDDMAKDGLCVSGFAKARARIAFEPFISKEDDLMPNPEWLTLERALLICECVDRGVPVPPDDRARSAAPARGPQDGRT